MFHIKSEDFASNFHYILLWYLELPPLPVTLGIFCVALFALSVWPLYCDPTQLTALSS